jgi:predicted transcriptional regulator
MAKRGALSVEEKEVIINTIKVSEDFMDNLTSLAETMDRTEDIILKYFNELKELGLIVDEEEKLQDDLADVLAPAVDPAVQADQAAQEEYEKLKREHMQQIYPSRNGATVGTSMASQYTDDVNLKRSTKSNKGKYTANVTQIRKEK